MENEGLNNLEQLEGVLRNMYLENKIDDNKYYSGLISLGLSHAILDHRDEAIELINKISNEFIINELPNLLKNNSILKSKAEILANYLDAGVEENEAEDAKIDLMLAGMDRSNIN